MKFNPSIGMLVLAVFLVLTGLAMLINLRFSGWEYLMGALAIAAGALIAVNK
jgi:hypothetical protein